MGEKMRAYLTDKKSIGNVIAAMTVEEKALLITGLVSCGLSATARSIVTGFFLLTILCFSSNQGRFEAWTMRKKLKEDVTKEFAVDSSN